MKTITRIAESRCEAYTRNQLRVLSWDLRKSKDGGDVDEKQELRNNPILAKLLPYETPEFVLYLNNKPAVTIECKATKEQIREACYEAKEYADKLKLKIAIGVAGNDNDGVIVRNYYKTKIGFKVVTHKDNPLTQILSKKYVKRLLDYDKAEIEIEIPDENRFYEQADIIHNLLRNSGIPKERMAPYLGTIILAFSENNRILKNTDYENLEVLNTLAQQKIKKYKKTDLISIFKIPEPNSDVFNKLKKNLPLIINSLQRLDVPALLETGSDILGRFFEIFLRYSNDKKQLGIVFTPRHIVNLMCDLVNIKYTDKVLDPCCGTGGFLVSTFTKMRSKLESVSTLSNIEKEKELIKIKEKRIYGLEAETDGIIYGLACLNMIFRGDGNTNIEHKDCFTKKFDFKFDKVLINPPYSQSKKGTNGEKEIKFLDYCLENLKIGGYLCAIIPYSIMCDNSKWRRSMIQKHTVIASISVPAELFYPISSPAIIVLFEAHKPQNEKPIFLGRIEDDGFKIDRQKRTKINDGQQKIILENFREWKALHDISSNKAYFNQPKFIKTQTLKSDDYLLEIVPEAHLENKEYTKEQIENEVDYLLREQLCFQLKYSQNLLRSGYCLNNESDINKFLKKLSLTNNGNKKIKYLSDFFEQRKSRGKIVYCEYGQKELHDKGWLKPGNDIIIAAGGVENGLYGFFDFPPYYKKPVLTSPSSGSICKAYVQEFPCSAYDNTIVLIPKVEVDLLYYIAAFIRLEEWRYRYGRQITPVRLGNLLIDMSYYDKNSIHEFRKNFPFFNE